MKKLHGVPKLASGKEENTAAAVYTILPDWSVVDHVKALCSDTTCEILGTELTLASLIFSRLTESSKRPPLPGLSTRHH